MMTPSEFVVNKQDIIIYKTTDDKTEVALYARDGNVWMNQNQLTELFATSKPNISMHISNILKEKELDKNSVVKDYLTTAPDGKEYNVTFYSLGMILAIGFSDRQDEDELRQLENDIKNRPEAEND